MMFDEAEIQRMNAIVRLAEKYDKRWKQIPASDGRLKAMAKRVTRGLIQPHEVMSSLNNLSPDELSRYNDFVKENQCIS